MIVVPSNKRITIADSSPVVSKGLGIEVEKLLENLKQKFKTNVKVKAIPRASEILDIARHIARHTQMGRVSHYSPLAFDRLR